MPDEGFAAVEAPEMDTSGAGYSEPDTAADATAETADTTESAESGEDSGAPPVAPGKAIVNGKLSAEAQQAITDLKAKNPALAESLRRALFTEEKMRRELPGGLAEVKQLRERIESLGGDNGIREVQAEMNGWREFDQQYMAGDPKVLDFLMESPEGKDAFLKIAPSVFNRYAEAHPEGFSAYMAQAFDGYMSNAGIPLLVERLGDLIPQDNPKALEAYQKLARFVKGIGEMASKPVAAPKREAPASDPRADQLSKENQELKRNDWLRQANQSHHSTAFRAAMKQVIGDKKLTPVQSSALQKLYLVEIKEALGKKADFNPGLERYFQAGQRDGFMKLFGETYKTAVPQALRSAAMQLGLIGDKKIKPAQTAQPGGPAKTPTGKPAATGFTMVATKPDMATQVNRNATSPEMWARHQAILKDGKKVTWK